MKTLKSDKYSRFYDTIISIMISTGFVMAVTRVFTFANERYLNILSVIVPCILTAIISVVSRRKSFGLAFAGLLILAAVLYIMSKEYPKEWLIGFLKWWYFKPSRKSEYWCFENIFLIHFICSFMVSLVTFFLIRKMHSFYVMLSIEVIFCIVLFLEGFSVKLNIILLILSGCFLVLVQRKMYSLSDVHGSDVSQKKPEQSFGICHINKKSIFAAAVVMLLICVTLSGSIIPQDVSSFNLDFFSDFFSGRFSFNKLSNTTGRIGDPVFLSDDKVLSVKSASRILLRENIFTHYISEKRRWTKNKETPVALVTSENNRGTKFEFTIPLDDVSYLNSAEIKLEKGYHYFMLCPGQPVSFIFDSNTDHPEKLYCVPGYYQTDTTVVYMDKKPLKKGDRYAIGYNAVNVTQLMDIYDNIYSPDGYWRMNGSSSEGETLSRHGTFFLENIDSSYISSQYEHLYSVPEFYDNYCDVPESIKENITSLSDNLTNGIENPFDKISALMKYFSENDFIYTRQPQVAPKDQDFISFFLNTKEGYCMHFATAMALMARASGIPSRLVTGYALKPEGNKQSYYNYSASESTAHAWVELFLPNCGWLEFDPTSMVPNSTTWGDSTEDTTDNTETTASDQNTTSEAASASSTSAEENNKDKNKGSFKTIHHIILCSGSAFILILAFLALIYIKRFKEQKYQYSAAIKNNRSKLAYLSDCHKNIIKILKIMKLKKNDGETDRLFFERAETALNFESNKKSSDAGTKKPLFHKSPAHVADGASFTKFENSELKKFIDIMMKKQYSKEEPTEEEMLLVESVRNAAEEILRKKVHTARFWLYKIL